MFTKIYAAIVAVVFAVLLLLETSATLTVITLTGVFVTPFVLGGLLMTMTAFCGALLLPEED